MNSLYLTVYGAAAVTTIILVGIMVCCSTKTRPSNDKTNTKPSKKDHDELARLGLVADSQPVSGQDDLARMGLVATGDNSGSSVM